MRRLFLASFYAGTLLMAAPPLVANAADMPAKAPPAPAATAWNWTGLYVGVDAGYTSDRVGIYDPATPASGTAVANANSVSLGAHVGYLYQLNNPMVVGVEGDASWLNGKSLAPFPGTPITGIAIADHWDGSVRGVVGVAVDRAMLYGTGGWAWLEGSMCGNGPLPATTVCFAGSNGPNLVSGWVAGAGVAYAITDRLSARVEYLHADYGHFSYTGVWTGGSVNVTDTNNTVRAGLSYKFSLR